MRTGAMVVAFAWVLLVMGSSVARADEVDTLLEVLDEMKLLVNQEQTCEAQAASLEQYLGNSLGRIERLGQKWRERAVDAPPTEAQEKALERLPMDLAEMCGPVQNAFLLALTTFESGREAARAKLEGPPAPPAGSVGVVVVFPISKDYIEEFYGLRGNIATVLERLDDAHYTVAVVAYDKWALPALGPLPGTQVAELAQSVRELENTEHLEPNVFEGMAAALGKCQSMYTERKVIVLISNAEGGTVGIPEAVEKATARFEKGAGEVGVETIVVGYTPDGPDELTYRHVLQGLADDGRYFEATELDALPAALDKAWDAIEKP